MKIIGINKKGAHFGAKNFLAILVICFFATISAAYDRSPLKGEILPDVAHQGEICLIRVSAPEPLQSIYAEFQGVKIPMSYVERSSIAEALLGIDLDALSGRYEVVIKATSSLQKFFLEKVKLKIKKVHFPIQRLSLPPAMVDLDAKTLARVNGEERRLKELFKKGRAERFWQGGFIKPVPGEVTTSFGVRRVINNLQRSPHTGVDLKAEEGTPVLACNNGVVVMVDDLFFSGKSVILDHGRGFFSMYFHLSQALVKEGKMIRKGDILGRVGSTGRSSGAHLHWGIRINGARVDPLSLLRLLGSNS